jgi:hypothetical protein
MIDAIGFFASHTFIDIVIVILIAESLLVAVIGYRAGNSGWFAPLVTNAAGICLLYALRSALAEAGPVPVVIALAGALVAHAADMRLRFSFTRAHSS